MGDYKLERGRIVFVRFTWTWTSGEIAWLMKISNCDSLSFHLYDKETMIFSLCINNLA